MSRNQSESGDWRMDPVRAEKALHDLYGVETRDQKIIAVIGIVFWVIGLSALFSGRWILTLLTLGIFALCCWVHNAIERTKG